MIWLFAASFEVGLLKLPSNRGLDKLSDKGNPVFLSKLFQGVFMRQFYLGKLGNKILYDTYLKWCNKNNERPLSHKGLSMRIQEKGFKRCVSNSQRFWLGLMLKNEWMGYQIVIYSTSSFQSAYRYSF